MFKSTFRLILALIDTNSIVIGYIFIMSISSLRHLIEWYSAGSTLSVLYYPVNFQWLQNQLLIIVNDLKLLFLIKILSIWTFPSLEKDVWLKPMLLFVRILMIIFIRWLLRADNDIIFLDSELILTIFLYFLKLLWDALIHIKLNARFYIGLFIDSIRVRIWIGLISHHFTRSLFFKGYLFYHLIICDLTLFDILPF